ncbi:unnamed protein product [Caenorhabditis angaria]|uniref:Serpentine Receptor, class H n=1 Tax=Caenorhabditis angaria TaxID=860376 RepID=A0A9P1IV67_9PELO|nr:unnamed protein product [Caenorhabditis angaria]
MIPAYLNEPNQVEAKLIILKTMIPCPTTEFFDSPVYVLIPDESVMTYPILVYICIMATQIFYFIIHSFLYLFQSSPQMSIRTRELQKKFLIGICIQVAIPNAMFNIAVLCSNFHGMSATFVLIYINEPYRTFTIRLFKKHQINRSVSDIVTSRYLG